MNIPYVFKKCSRCGEWKVASNEKFGKQKNGKYELKSQCKECEKQYRKENKDKIAKCKKQYRKKNKDKIREQNKQYEKENKDRIKERKRRYRERNKDKIREQKRQYYQENKEKIKERVNKYNKTPQGQISQFNARNKRRQREEQQGAGFTPEQWKEMMKYFDFKCAYSGEYIGGNSKHRTIDHIMPISKGGLNEIWNLVPAFDSYNFSKHDKSILEWYKEQEYFSEERLNKIYEWQEYAFNKWSDNAEKNKLIIWG